MKSLIFVFWFVLASEAVLYTKFLTDFHKKLNRLEE